MLLATVRSFQHLLHRPTRVLWLCGLLAASSLAFDGSALHLWSMRRDHRELERRIEETRLRSRHLDFQIHEALQPEFIERQARDQFDLVKEGDLVFVFSDDGSDSKPER